jgi:hypothetical protein
MPYLATFDCLWCGTHHATRDADAVEGWAQLCPACVGRAGDNGFLRFRLRAALEERGRARPRSAPTERAAAPAAAPLAPVPSPLASAPPDDWYRRAGVHTAGAIDDARFAADLDAVTLRLDARLPAAGEAVEPGAGRGWWAPLIAGRLDLTVLDADGPALDAARARLLAHGLRAHLHRRDPWAPPDRAVDLVFGAFLVGRTATADLASLAGLLAAWLRPGGRFLGIERFVGDHANPVVDEAVPGPRPVAVAAVEAALRSGGFAATTIEPCGRFLLVEATR